VNARLRARRPGVQTALAPAGVRPRVDVSLRPGAGSWHTDGASYISTRCNPGFVTREAVVEGYERFVGDAIELTVEEFSMSRALSSGVSGSSRVVDKLLDNSDRLREHVVEPELDTYRTRAFDQLDVLLDYAESEASIDAYHDELLATGPFENELREDLPEDRLRDIVTYILGRHKRFAQALVPLIDSPESEFWPAVLAELDAERAHELVDEHFRYTEPLREYPDAFRMSTSIDPSDVLGPFGTFMMGSITVEYTDEAIRAATAAEQEILERTRQKVDDRFD
jgi:hypothetical protein